MLVLELTYYYYNKYFKRQPSRDCRHRFTDMSDPFLPSHARNKTRKYIVYGLYLLPKSCS